MSDYKRLIQHDELEIANDLLNSKKDENIILIWVDDHIDNKIKDAMTQINDDDKNDNIICCNSQHAIDCIDKNEFEKIIIIVAGKYSQEIIPLIHNKDKIDSIYIFCLNSNKYQLLIDMRKYSKILGIYTEYQQLFDLMCCKKQLCLLIKFRLINQKQNAIHFLSNDSTGYLFYQVLKHLLFLMPKNDQNKIEMLNSCRYYYRNHPSQLKLIDEFENKYIPEDAIS
ncbi:unnamed protein product [Rotaria sp. Silwood2]|nr:unnamed protein product [Rotaria sp. Silwood2]